MKLLLIEDEAALAESVAEFLKQDSDDCDIATTYDEGITRVDLYDYDCILVDIMLPDGNGLDIIRHIKSNHDNTGILVISARDAVDDRVKGLELGADDYLTKPFHLAELNARIKAIVRRKQFDGQPVITYDLMQIHTDKKQVYIGNTEVLLTKTEYDLLLYLLANQERVVTRISLAEHLIGDDADHLDDFNFIYSHVKNLRRKITEAGGEDYLRAIYGIGYKLSLP
jgi:DNA-binding response OmpR family regulator